MGTCLALLFKPTQGSMDHSLKQESAAAGLLLVNSTMTMKRSLRDDEKCKAQSLHSAFSSLLSVYLWMLTTEISQGACIGPIDCFLCSLMDVNSLTLRPSCRIAPCYSYQCRFRWISFSCVAVSLIAVRISFVRHGSKNNIQRRR